MKRLIFAALALLIAPALAAASEGVKATVDAMVDNKVRVSSAEGQYDMTMTPDGAYETTRDTAGTWALNETMLCFVRTTGEQSCVPVAEDKSVGDSWTIPTPNGDVVVAIVAAD